MSIFLAVLFVWYMTGCLIAVGIGVGLRLIEPDDDGMKFYISAAFLSWYAVGLLSIPMVISAILTKQER